MRVPVQPGNIPTNLALLRQTGARWVRINVAWSTVQPSQPPPVTYDWSTYDPVMDTTAALGLEPILTLFSTPTWASLNGDPNCAAKSEPAPAHLSDFAAFCTAIGQHYLGKVRYYQIWNEPNGAGNFIVTSGCAGPDDPAKAVRDYCQLLKIGADALHNVDPNIKVLMGGMGYGLPNPRPTFFADCMNDPTNPAWQSADIYDLHFYGPTSAPPGSSSPGLRDWIDQFRSVVPAQGTRPFFCTETGKQSLQADGPVGQSRQIRQVFPAMLQYGVEVVLWYQLSDSCQGCPDQPEAWGLIGWPAPGCDRTQYGPKLGYYALREFIQGGGRL